MIIEEDYVSYETAKLLKEKGFDCKCSCYYSFDNGEDKKFNKYSLDWDWNNDCLLRYCYSAPTLQITMKWLREVHNIHICYSLGYADDSPWYTVYIHKIDGGDCQDIPLRFNYKTCEEACEAAIKYCLENLI